MSDARASCAAGAPTGLDCVERLEVPQYPGIGQRAAFRADIEASIVLKPDGSIESTRLTSAAPASVVKLFEPEIDRAIRSSRFSTYCRAQVVTVVFQFRLTANVGDDYRAVSFGVPNRFEIVASLPRINPTLTR